MKRLPHLPTLLTALLITTLAPNARAQTPLLEIDYNGATVFHVLSDGRVLLPEGAADGYVLTADADGYGTWQAVSGNGGLTAVSSDTTLTGDGTASAPLGVTVPLVLTGSDDAGVVRSTHSNGTYGSLSNSDVGVFGINPTGNFGYLGGMDYGVYGVNDNGNYGVLGGASGAYGVHNSGNVGWLGTSLYGVYGGNDNNNWGYLGHDDYGVYGGNANGNYGFFGSSASGAYGEHINGHFGRLGGSFYGIYGQNSNTNRGYLGHDDYGVWGTGSPWAGYFEGNVHVTGTLSKGGGSFKIDHPLDPADRYLSHSFVESPDMMNVYNGNVRTDAAGEAVVELPDYFEALNDSFRYQLTVIGQFAQAIVAEEIEGNQFLIRTDVPHVKVSWQVTGIRRDAWANENRIVVEEDKKPEDRGFYLHPQLYGRSEARRIGGVEEAQEGLEDREAMRQRMEEDRRQIEQEHRRVQAERERIQNERAQRPPRPDNEQ